MSQDLPARWTSPQWRREALAWLEDVARARGVTVTGPVEQPRTRFWSTQLRVTTDAGVWWFKENAPSQAFEAALLVEVERLAPGHVVPPLAVEAVRGWLVTEDAGVTMWDQGEATIDQWHRIVREYAVMQRTLEAHESALLATGLAAFEESQAVAWIERTLAELERRPAGHPLGVTSDQSLAIRAGLHVVERDVALLEQSRLPASLQHNDLHPGNAFVPPSPHSPLRFIDFGDAVWSHPFCALRIPSWMIRHRLQVAVDDPRLTRLVDDYLTAWSDHGSLAELRPLLPAAERLSCLHRALSWHRLHNDVPAEAVDADYRDSVVSWLTMATAEVPYEA